MRIPTPRRVMRRARILADDLRADTTAFREGARDARNLPSAAAPPGTRPPGRPETYFDGVTEGPGVWKWRHYFPIYERHLSRFVGTEFTLVEVGIYSGGSLAMWRDYFGPGCRIVGIDIEEACSVYASDGVEVMIGDQADPAFWKRFREAHPSVDVLIDDGGHEAHQQQVTLRETLAHLAPGGVYLCEDIHWPHHVFHSYVDGLSRELHVTPPLGGQTPPTNFQQHVESVHRYPFVTVIEKPALRVAPFDGPKHGTQWQPYL